MTRTDSLRVVIAFMLAAPIAAQDRERSAPPRAFAAATVKLNRSGARARNIGFEPGGRFVARNMPVRFVIGRAYGEGSTLPPYLLEGGPSWIETEPYDIEAVAEGADLEGRDEAGRRAVLLEMLRALLADRFTLRAHWAPRERPVYLLVRSRRDGRLGPGVTPSTDAECRPALSPVGSDTRPLCGSGPMNEGVLSGYGMTLPEIARTLQFYLERPVIDRTGLSGTFNFNLRFALELPGSPVIGDTSIFAALPEQLGLKVEPRREAVNVLIIDGIERPSVD